jgi:adenylosuccinate synthase
MPCTVTVGGFFGDEGKGKVIAYLAKNDNVSIAVRGGVGPNAGHTFVYGGKTHKVRMLPSAVLNLPTKLLIGAGVLIDTEILLNEVKTFAAYNRTLVDRQCGIIEKAHIEKDQGTYLKNRIGTTGSGTGPANADRALRTLRLAKDVHDLSQYIEDVSNSINHALDKNESILVEGTQGTFLSLFHGIYPYVTSRDVCASSICSDVGIGPKRVEEVLVIFKAYVTRVGEGPLDNEVNKEEVGRLGWAEFGSVTGRQRRASPFDMQLAKKAISLNSATQLAVTKLDVLFPESAGVRKFEKLPTESKKFIENIEAETGLKVSLVGTGADVDDIIDRRAMK